MSSPIDNQRPMPETLFYRPLVDQVTFGVNSGAAASETLANIVGRGFASPLWYGEYKLVRKFRASLPAPEVRIHEERLP